MRNIINFINSKAFFTVSCKLLEQVYLKIVRNSLQAMPKEDLSFFDEKRSVVKAETDWGCWWQTVQEIHISIKLPEKTSSKQIQVKVKPKHIQCTVHGKVVLEGELPRPVYADEVIWTIEDGNLCIVLSKADYYVKDAIWESLLSEGKYQPDPWTVHEMRKNVDLERFQIENPGMDFSGAKLSKNYDRLPGWSNDRLAEIKNQQEKSDTIAKDESG